MVKTIGEEFSAHEMAVRLVEQHRPRDGVSV